ncbi:hypothetical protein QNN03_18275 [Streptomyces sp. GXMU-J15]|uniref:Uncharacterized protein n=1 Tax=Streptomyces fuscus TaxID=3048495 RepID=A0ABT7J0J5_9ACTN|nr:MULTISPECIES: hypothetical protein [Streptomyces]MDL2078383.1 hypothetical protein [Streptomyces fuscus]SBT92993.1 hypothetical protein GA0115233_105516 [Streptomyces sp. DI166]
MADTPRGRPVEVDGQELIAVSGEEFVGLSAAHRQVSGRNTRVRVLSGTVEELRRVLGEVGAVHVCAGTGCAVCAVVDEATGRVRTTREGDGRRRSAR